MVGVAPPSIVSGSGPGGNGGLITLWNISRDWWQALCKTILRQSTPLIRKDVFALLQVDCAVHTVKIQKLKKRPKTSQND